MSRRRNRKMQMPHVDRSKAVDGALTANQLQVAKVTEDKSKQELKQNLNNSELVLYYGYLLGQLQYEGGGIWSRFNIMIGLNISLFGLMALLYSPSVEDRVVLRLIVSTGGFLFSAWSLHALKRLWLYHYHWKDNLQNIEKLLPDGLVKPFTVIPAELTRRKRNAFKVWFKTYTQPYFLILIVIWSSSITVDALSIIKSHRTISNKPDKTASKIENNVTEKNSNSKSLTENS